MDRSDPKSPRPVLSVGAVAYGALYEDSQRDGRSLAPDDTRYRFRTQLKAGTVDGLSDADGARFVDAGRDSDFLAPSLLAARRPSAAVTARAALRSSCSRPSFDLIAGRTSIARDPVAHQITAISQPNPDLEPLRATSLDFGLDYEAGAGKHLQLARYHKKPKNIVVSTATISEANNGITYLRPANGRFGVDGSVTAQKTQAEYMTSGGEVRESTLPQAPDLIYSARLFYEGAAVRANLQYNWTGRYLTVLRNTQPDVLGDHRRRQALPVQ